MRRVCTSLFAVGILCLGLAGCGDDDGSDNTGDPDAGDGDNPDASQNALGNTTVNLPLWEKYTRNQEALIGNLVADAMFDAFEVDIAFIGGGALRCPEEFDNVQCEGFEIQAGPIVQADLEVMLPFANGLVIKDITGADLKSTLERSVATIPSERKGWFMHVSGATYEADCNNQAQALTIDDSAIAVEGERVTDITVGGEPFDPDATYTIVAGGFAAAGNDGHILLGEAAEVEASAETEITTMVDYLAANDPVTPAIEGRIVLTDCVND